MTKSRITKLSFISISLLMICFACEREIILNHGNYIPKIVMNGIIAHDSLIEVRVSKSFLYTDTLSEKSLLRDASLTLFINGQPREEMRMTGVDTIRDYDRLGFHYTALMSVFRSTLRAKMGDKIRIEASATGFNPAWAETTVPVPPQINQIDTTTFFTTKKIINNNDEGYYPDLDYSQIYPENIKVESQFRNMRLKMAITGDPHGGKQYFLLRVRKMNEQIGIDADIEGNYFYLYTDDDPVFDENHKNSILEDIINEGTDFEGKKYSESELFSNKLFRNNQYTLDFSITDYYFIFTTYEERENENGNDWGWGYYPPVIYVPLHTEVYNPPLEVQFTAISPELYPYYRKGKYDPHSDEESLKLISEPEITFSNVHNGIGVVGAISSATTRVEIPPFPGGKDIVPRSY